MRKIRKWLILLLWSAAVIALAVAAYTNLIFNDSDGSVPVVTVVLDNDSAGKYDNMKLGLQRAANEAGAKIYYDVLGSEGEMQADDMTKELQSRKLLIVRCDANEDFTQAALDADSTGRKTVLVNPDPVSKGDYSVLSSDETGRGEHLGDLIADTEGKDTQVYVCGARTESAKQRAEGLKNAGLSVTDCTRRDEAQSVTNAFYQAAADENSKRNVIVAMSPDTMNLVLEETGSGTSAGLYGFGSDNTILTAMENGKVRAVSVVSEYNLGYQSMKAALRLAGTGRKTNLTLESFSISKEDMFAPQYSDILFPQ